MWCIVKEGRLQNATFRSSYLKNRQLLSYFCAKQGDESAA